VNPNKIAKDDWMPLHLACSQGHIEAVKLLITVGNADVNVLVGRHGSPLHSAARAGRVQVVSYLLMHKADTE
jgi:ankyrin repeat protein